MTPFVSGAFLLFFAMLVEIWIWRRVHPGQAFRLSALYRALTKKYSPLSPWPALFFASATTLIFQFWESFLRFLLGLGTSPLSQSLSLVGVVLLVVLSAYRVRKTLSLPASAWPPQRLEILFFHVSFSLLLGSWVCLLLLPWVHYRSRDLGPLRI